jgi:hypothetical protein
MTTLEKIQLLVNRGSPRNCWMLLMLLQGCGIVGYVLTSVE